ncbi:MAG TPA: AI-2E family transporter [Thermoanaerobaculia bacterium]|nr:AI-2E family transporter [Thermoanaerobaculia bacterium]
MLDKTLNRYFFIALLVSTTVLFFWMIRSFLMPVLLAAVFCTLFYPLYENLLRVFWGKKTLASLACCVILLLLLILPIYWILYMVTLEATHFYATAKEQILRAIELGEAGPLGRLRNLPWVQRFGLHEIDWRTRLEGFATGAAGGIATFVRTASAGTLQVVLTLFITLFTMFYFFKEGKSLLRRLRYLVPLDREYKNAIVQRFSSVARATVRGTMLIALIQGTLAGLTLWACGVGSPILWGVVATLFSIIPLVGAWLVLYPAAFIQIATGNWTEGFIILGVTVLVIVNVDNLLRPRLVGQEAGMHDLMVFFSTLGGIGMFGAMGFIIGPMIAALFLAVIDIYSAEFKEDLEITRIGTEPALPQLEPPAARVEPVPDPSPGPEPSPPPARG